MKRAIILCLLAACGGDGKVKQDAGMPPDDAALDASCFTNPQTHYEIINACTNAQKIYKDSHPALLNPDGTVPALP